MSQISQSEDSSKQKPGYFDQLWQALIRPSQRVKYSMSDLGPVNFMIKQTAGTREDFEVKNSRGNILKCSYFESRSSSQKPHPCVIYLHGNSSSRIEGLSLLAYLIPYDISLVLMDFAGCGMSEGEYISLGYFEKFDAGLAIDYVRSKKLITTFGVWGRSMGASTAIQLGCMRTDINFIVSDSSFLSIKQLSSEVAKRQYKMPNFVLKIAFYFIRKKIQSKANFDIQECDTLKSFQSPLNRPSILFLAAKDDQLINYQHSVQLFQEYKGPKNILLFEGNHNSKRPNDIQNEVSLFFRKNLYQSQPLQPKMNLQKQQNIQNNEPDVLLLGGGNNFMSNANQQKNFGDDICESNDSDHDHDEELNQQRPSSVVVKPEEKPNNDDFDDNPENHQIPEDKSISKNPETQKHIQKQSLHQQFDKPVESVP